MLLACCLSLALATSSEFAFWRVHRVPASAERSQRPNHRCLCFTTPLVSRELQCGHSERTTRGRHRCEEGQDSKTDGKDSKEQKSAGAGLDQPHQLPHQPQQRLLGRNHAHELNLHCRLDAVRDCRSHLYLRTRIATRAWSAGQTSTTIDN